MNKLWVAIVVGIIAGGIGTGVYIAKNRSQKILLPNDQSQNVPTIQTNLLTWNDPAGFQFQYPDGLTIDKHDEDKENYAHIEFLNKDHTGNVIVWARDTTSADVKAWVRTEKRFKDANILDTTLGEKSAKKILLATASSSLIVGAIDDAILFTVEADLDEEGYWSKIHDGITKSFIFTSGTSEKKSNESSGNGNSQQSSGGEEVPVDEEETIE